MSKISEAKPLSEMIYKVDINTIGKSYIELYPTELRYKATGGIITVRLEDIYDIRMNFSKHFYTLGHLTFMRDDTMLVYDITFNGYDNAEMEMLKSHLDDMCPSLRQQKMEREKKELDDAVRLALDVNRKHFFEARGEPYDLPGSRPKKIPCQYCNSQVDAAETRCTSCGAPITR
jgi:hypothetical protein